MLRLFVFLFGINERFHAVVKEGIWLHEVCDVEGIFLVFSCVLDPVIEPLSKVRRTISVCLEGKLILVGISLYYFP